MLKQYLKRFLLGMGLYYPVHRVWVRHPDIRLDMYNFGYRLADPIDRLPLPPTRLIQLVQINGEIAVYLRGRARGKKSICNALLRNGYHFEDFETILDFGCGCGRIMRQWRGMDRPRLYGSELNPELIRWCQVKLGKLAEFET